MSKTTSDLSSHTYMNRAPATQLRDWPAEDLSRIRLVFRRLMALRVENPDDAEDLVQETFLTMTEKFPAVELRKGLLVWGMGILRKKVGNYYRRGQRVTGLDQEALDIHVARLFKTQPSVESGVHHMELRSLVSGILEKFPAHERAVMDLVLQGLPTSEIVDLLHPERYQNVVNRIHRARTRLHRELAKYGYSISHSSTENRGRKPAKPAKG